jgi:aflatoxin B1 aldehyde reductase
VYRLLPCLRRHDIRFAAYSPLAGGLLVGYLFANDGGQAAAGSRFDPANPLAGVFEGRYGRLRPIARTLNAAAVRHACPLHDVSLIRVSRSIRKSMG